MLPPGTTPAPPHRPGGGGGGAGGSPELRQAVGRCGRLPARGQPGDAPQAQGGAGCAHDRARPCKRGARPCGCAKQPRPPHVLPPARCTRPAAGSRNHSPATTLATRLPYRLGATITSNCVGLDTWRAAGRGGEGRGWSPCRGGGGRRCIAQAGARRAYAPGPCLPLPPAGRLPPCLHHPPAACTCCPRSSRCTRCRGTAWQPPGTPAGWHDRPRGHVC